MDILRSIARGLSIIGMGFALSTWIVLATLNATLLNRDVTLQWLQQSGAYQQGLTSLVGVQPDQTNTTSLTSADTLQKALVATFPPSYIQQATEEVINATYDWVEGKAATVHFSIPVQEKSAEFSANLAAIIEPQLAALPACSSRITSTDVNAITCLPPGINAAEYAKQLTQPADGSGFLTAPLTEQTLIDSGTAPTISWLPVAAQWVRILAIALPITALALACFHVLMSPNRLRGVGNVGRQAVISGIVTLIGGAFIWYASSSIDLAGSFEAQNQQIARSLVNPLARAVLPTIGSILTLYSGMVVVTGGVLWLSMFLLRRRAEKNTVVAGAPHSDIPPPTTTETHLPPPQLPKK